MKTSDQHFPRLTDNDDGEISLTVDGVEIRGWSYVNPDEHYLKMRMAREFVEGWHAGFGTGLDRASEAVRETFGKNISDGGTPSLAGTSRTDKH